MISEKSYDELRDKEIVNFNRAYMTPLKSLNLSPAIPDTLVELLTTKSDIETLLSQLRSIKIPPLNFNIIDVTNKEFDSLEENSKNETERIKRESNEKRESLRSDYESRVNSARDYNDSLITPIREKHLSLLEYKDDLNYIFDHYSITPLDIEISEDISVDEFNTLINESINVCTKYKKKDLKLFDKILNPLKDESNLAFTLSYTAIILVVVYVLLPIVAVPAFIVLFLSVHNMYKDLEKLRIASSLMSQIDYKRFVPEQSFKVVDEPDFKPIEDDTLKKLEGVKHYDKERDELLKYFEKRLSEDSDMFNAERNKIVTAYNEAISDLQETLVVVERKIQEEKARMKPFPTLQNDSVVMSHTYTLGRLNGLIDVTHKLPLLNLVFNSTDREKAINNMKLYLANALLSVRVKQLTIEIYDPKNMCGDFTEFFTQETKPYIKPNTMTLSDLLKTYKTYSQKNVIDLDKQDIDSFNKEAEEKELVPKEYKLLLLISDLKSLHEGNDKDMFAEYFKFSASSGVMIWLLDSREWPNSVWVDGSYKLDGNKIEYTTDIGRVAVETFTEALKNYRDTGIDYVTKFGDVFIPREKWWTFDTIKGIKMPFGLEKGDPTRGLNVCPVIGDANVHALLGGTTGAGKSAAINQLLVSLITMYPPSELMLVYIDFKNVEAAKFTAGFDQVQHRWMDTNEEKILREKEAYYSRLSRIPHLHIISGTTDGEYALSVFEFLMEEMARRQSIINKFGVTKVEEMRKQILSSYNKEHNGDAKKGTWADMRRDWEWYKVNVYDKYGDLPRLLVIFDEFQVMYNPEFVDNRVIDQINGKITAITKLARAMAAHFWFVSQSMKGTMSKDTMANFSLRGALRCTKEVSEELIGNGAAGEIKQKFGFMYTNDTAGTDKEANRLWRVPFLDEKDIPKYVDELNNMLDEFNEKHRMAEFYDEKILVPSSVLDIWYQNYGDAFSNPNSFVLGERANYSTNKAPVTLSLQNDGGENIIMAAFDRTDMLNLVLTMVDNLRHKEDKCTILMNIQDKETHTLLDVENIVDEKFLEMSYPKFDISDLVDNLDAMVEHRIEVGGEYKPVYVFCVQWERAPYISVDINYKIQDKFKDVLRKAPNVGIHFIMASRERLEMPRMIPSACNHRVVGLMPKDAMHFIETNKVEKLPDASKDAGIFAFYEFGTQLVKFRIYQHVFTKSIQSRDIIIK